MTPVRFAFAVAVVAVGMYVAVVGLSELIDAVENRYGIRWGIGACVVGLVALWAAVTLAVRRLT